MTRRGELLTCDLICYGVASPRAWREYLDMLGRHHGSPVVDYAHRGSGIRDRGDAVARYADGTSESGTSRTRLWSRLWYKNLLRESCLTCPHHSLARPGNLTIGDFWGLGRIAPELVDAWGVSCVLANDGRGLELLGSVAGALELLETTAGSLANPDQPMLSHSPDQGRGEAFWSLERAVGFEGACRELGLLGPTRGLRDLVSKLAARGGEAGSERVPWPSAGTLPGGADEGTTWPRAFAARNRSEEIRRMSSSGGVFLALAEEALRRGGVVYGCAYDAGLHAVHVRCETMEDVLRCMGSKYVQSDLGGALRAALDDLDAGRVVLFTGTPCQVAAVRRLIEGRGAAGAGSRQARAKQVPTLFRAREECCGCSACATACASGAIEMRADEKGFLYPAVNTARCVRCGACLSACP